jgi:hypothetical protein
MPWGRFERIILAFERKKTADAFDRATTVIGNWFNIPNKNQAGIKTNPWNQKLIFIMHSFYKNLGRKL